jgi:small-conductance mechanosensitive channel
MEINREYLTDYYNYLTENGFSVTNSKKRGTYSHTQVFAYKADNPKALNQGDAANYYHEKLYNENNFSSFIKDTFFRIFCIDNEEVPVDFFIKFYNKTTKEKKLELLKEIELVLGYSWSSYALKIIDNVSKTNKEIISTLNSFPISVLDVTKINLQELHKFLTKNDIKSEELDNFYIKFFKSRKNQFKDARTGPIVLKFLLEVYGRDETKLKPYFEFSNHVKTEFKSVDLDFTDMLAKNVITTRINCRKASQLLCIPGYNENKIESEISSFVYCLENLLRFEEIMIESYDKQKSIIEVRCYTNTDFKQEELNTLIKEYLLFKKTEPDFPTTTSNVGSWITQRNLKMQLKPNESTHISSKMKI